MVGLFDMLSALKVFRLDKKIRIGNRNPERDGDGGYVVPIDALEHINTILTYGVGLDISFEIELASMLGKPCFCFDPNVHNLPVPDAEGIRFFQIGIGSRQGSLAEHVQMIDPQFPLLLKIDIEGNEWNFLQTEFGSINHSHIALIILELHGLLDVYDMTNKAILLKKITESFALVHVHGNNFRPYGNFDGIALPDVLETTWINKMLYHGEHNQMPFPDTTVDLPNSLQTNDIVLDTWPWISSSNVDEEQNIKAKLYSLRVAQGTGQRLIDIYHAEHDRAVSERDAAIQRCNIAIAERDQAAAERDAANQRYSKVVAERDILNMTLLDIQNSRSWKVVVKLKNLYRFFAGRRK